jgi:hypothetical protein
MILFAPSKSMLDAICENDSVPIISCEVHLFGSTFDMFVEKVFYQNSVFKKLNYFYADDLNGNCSLDKDGILNVCQELFKNWEDHGTEDSNLITGLFIGTKGVCYGFYDGGSFFKNYKIKERIESRHKFTEFDLNPRGGTLHKGFNECIYPFSDMLEVDAEKGIMYAVQLKERLIVPK